MTQTRIAALSPIILAAALFVGCEKTSPTSDGSSESASTSDANAAGASESQGAQTIEIVNQVVELSCGECNFELEGTSCDLAVRIDGVTYFVDGFAIDDFGDAHAADGLCNAIQSARVTGRIEGGRFIASAIEVLPQDQDAEAGQEEGNQP